MIRNRVIVTAFRLIVGAMFIWTGIIKLIAPLDFAQDISNYHVFRQGMVFFLALVLPWLELFCGLLLVLGVWRRAGAFLLSGMLISFLILIASTLIRGIDVECGCFGIFSRRVDYTLILTDVALLFMALTVLFAPRSFSSEKEA